MIDPLLRPALRTDHEFMASMLAEAANWNGLRAETPDSVRADPKSWRYLAGWQRPTDFGMVAIDGPTNLGAAWARVLAAPDGGYGWVDDSIPELTLAVVSSARGQGLGRRLLAGLVEDARARGLPALSLSVEDGNNRARSLYEHSGFVVVGRNGGSDTMLLELAKA
jgi:ribosomal protein S18 acetylase RimI-like enzyme